ncbi:hypothetical protein [Plantactinospora endophytica]|uniref:ESX-1 secretion-associated protein EspA/EspE-like domain-containing protein n=1 Tax=Plantactinospora endophytica TaxID=673535 RepID=A0ABQ4E934_9ACTN|nr:hypothetical protein [Plantactinospora endophytica]GIG91239.1 hypothetical protein Pen02_61750 [Plantactinospora endophytica]
MSYEVELRNKAHQIWKKCVEWAEKMQSKEDQPSPPLDAGQRAEMASWSQIPGLFEPFAQLPDPDSGAFQTMIEDLKAAMGELSDGKIMPHDKPNKQGEQIPMVGDMVHMDIRNLIDGWTGSASQAFIEFFIKPFPANLQSQFIAVHTLRSAIQAYQSVWRSARKDAMEVADKTLDSLESNCSAGLSASVALTVVASVAGVGTAFASGPLLPGVLVLQVIAGTAQVGAAASQEKKTEITISGADPLVIVPKLRQALTKLQESIIEEQDEVLKVTQENLKRLGAGKDALIPKEPQLHKVTRGNVRDIIGNSY